MGGRSAWPCLCRALSTILLLSMLLRLLAFHPDAASHVARLRLTSTATRGSGNSSSCGSNNSSSGASARGRPSSILACDGDGQQVTHRELDMHHQRKCMLAQAGGHPPGGYLASCAIVKGERGWHYS